MFSGMSIGCLMYLNMLFLLADQTIYIYTYSRVLNFGNMLDTISVTRKQSGCLAAYIIYYYMTVCTTYTYILNETLIMYVKK